MATETSNGNQLITQGPVVSAAQNTTVAVTASTSAALAANALRRMLIIQNLSTTVQANITFGPTNSSSNMVALPPATANFIPTLFVDWWTGAVSVNLSATGSVQLTEIQ